MREQLFFAQYFDCTGHIEFYMLCFPYLAIGSLTYDSTQCVLFVDMLDSPQHLNLAVVEYVFECIFVVAVDSEVGRDRRIGGALDMRMSRIVIVLHGAAYIVHL